MAVSRRISIAQTFPGDAPTMLRIGTPSVAGYALKSSRRTESQVCVSISLSIPWQAPVHHPLVHEAATQNDNVEEYGVLGLLNRRHTTKGRNSEP